MNDTVTRNTYVVYIYPGVVVGDELTKQITMRELNRTTREAPGGAIGFYYYDEFSSLVEVGVGNVPILLKSERMEISAVHYIDAKVLSPDDVRELGDSILVYNMGENQVLQHRHGGYQPLWNDNYRLVSST